MHHAPINTTTAAPISRIGRTIPNDGFSTRRTMTFEGCFSVDFNETIASPDGTYRAHSSLDVALSIEALLDEYGAVKAVVVKADGELVADLHELLAVIVTPSEEKLAAMVEDDPRAFEGIE